MKIYEIRLESFRNIYTGYWSSLEKACSDLPKYKKFLEILSNNYPIHKNYANNVQNPVYLSNDYAYNKNLIPKLEIEKNKYINIYIPGFRILRTEYKFIPKIKEKNKHYIPSKTIKKVLEPIIFNTLIRKAEISEIEVDIIHD